MKPKTDEKERRNYGDLNVSKLYTETTELNNPVRQVTDGNLPVQLLAIDNLPSILPKESSYNFSSQFSPFIENYNESEDPIFSALETYAKRIKALK